MRRQINRPASRAYFDLKAWRQEHGFTQTDLSEALGISRRTIINHEQGEAPLAIRLALQSLELGFYDHGAKLEAAVEFEAREELEDLEELAAYWRDRDDEDREAREARLEARHTAPAAEAGSARRSLLVVSCSATKAGGELPVPAIDRYLGAYYQMIGAHRRRGGPMPTIAILSAEHGIIAADTPIANYDRKLDQARAMELAGDPDQVIALEAIAGDGIQEIVIAGGRLYAHASRDIINQSARLSGCTITRTLGGIGEQRGQLGAWLGGLS